MNIHPLKAAIDTLEIDRWEVLYACRTIGMPVSMSPERFESYCQLRMTFRDLMPQAEPLASCIKALEQLQVRPVNTPGDIRWGIVFSDYRGKRTLSIFLDGNSDCGFINGQPVLFSSHLRHWFEGSILPFYRQ